jgi:hypothetical protein
MILFPDRSGTTWPDVLPDDTDPRARHVAPTRLELAPDHPAPLRLVRYTSSAKDSRGGSLYLALGLLFASPADGDHRAAMPDTRRVRLTWKGLGDTDRQHGDWREATLDASGVLHATLLLSPAEAQAAVALQHDDQAILEVELELGIRGRVPPIPWRVTGQTQAIRDILAARLGGGVVSREAVDAAVMSLPLGENGGVTWYPDTPGAAPVPDAVILDELAVRLRDDLFQRTDAGYRLGSLTGLPTQFIYDLSLPRSEVRRRVATWSISDAWRVATAKQRDAWLTIEDRVDIVQQSTVHVLMDLPLDPRQILRAQVKVSYPDGLRGRALKVLEFPRDGTHVTVPVLKIAGVDFEVSYQHTLFLAPLGPGRPPRPVRSPRLRRVDGLVVALNGLELDIRTVQLEADPLVFAHASSLEATIHHAGELVGRAELTSQHPTASVPLPGIAPRAPLEATVVAHPAPGLGDTPVTVIEGALGVETLRISPVDLAPRALSQFRFVVPPAVAERHGWVGLKLDEETLVTVDPDTPLRLRQLPAHVFDTPRCRYQLVTLPMSGDGTTSPLSTSRWLEATPGDVPLDPDAV